jgi:Lar family restriction alleviation protein
MSGPNEALLPCPFCGGEARLYRKPWSGHGEGGEYSVVACKSCPADVQAQDYTPDDARAIELWNARLAPLPASEAPVAWRAYGPGRWANSWQDGKPTADDLEYSRTRGYAITYAYARAESAAPASVPEGVRELVEAANRMGMAVSDHLRAGKLQCGSCEDDLSQLRTALAHPALRAFIGSET